MKRNEDENGRQLDVATDLEKRAQALVDSTRHVPIPADSYQVMGDLCSTVDAIRQVCAQLSRWHATVSDGLEFDAQIQRNGVSGQAGAAAHLGQAAVSLGAAAAAINRAQVANSVVRWRSPETMAEPGDDRP